MENALSLTKVVPADDVVIRVDRIRRLELCIPNSSRILILPSREVDLRLTVIITRTPINQAFRTTNDLNTLLNNHSRVWSQPDS